MGQAIPQLAGGVTTRCDAHGAGTKKAKRPMGRQDQPGEGAPQEPGEISARRGLLREFIEVRDHRRER